MGIWLQRVDKAWYRFLVTSGRLLSRKAWWAVWIGSLWLIIDVFYRPEYTKGATTSKWILNIFKFRNEYYKQIGKRRWKNGVICQVSVFPIWVMVLNLTKKVHFLQFAPTSTRNLSLLKQFKYMRLKGLATHFQKMLLLIMLWLTVSEILMFEVEEFC